MVPSPYAVQVQLPATVRVSVRVRIAEERAASSSCPAPHPTQEQQHTVCLRVAAQICQKPRQGRDPGTLCHRRCSLAPCGGAPQLCTGLDQCLVRSSMCAAWCCTAFAHVVYAGLKYICAGCNPGHLAMHESGGDSLATRHGRQAWLPGL